MKETKAKQIQKQIEILKVTVNQLVTRSNQQDVDIKDLQESLEVLEKKSL